MNVEIVVLDCYHCLDGQKSLGLLFETLLKIVFVFVFVFVFELSLDIQKGNQITSEKVENFFFTNDKPKEEENILLTIVLLRKSAKNHFVGLMRWRHFC